MTSPQTLLKRSWCGLIRPRQLTLTVPVVGLTALPATAVAAPTLVQSNDYMYLGSTWLLIIGASILTLALMLRAQRSHRAQNRRH